MTEHAIQFEGVRRTFGSTVALHDFDLRVEPGSVVGLVGRNGAGKSTALRLALGLLHPDSGDVRVLGFDPVRQGLEVRRRASLMAEESSLYPWMKVREILDFAASLEPNWDPERAEDLRERLDLDPGIRIGGLSRGNRAKVGLIIAVAPRPSVLLLDDPTASLDPLARREVLEGILESVPAEGGAVLYASHLVHDIERVADRVLVLDDGRVTLEGDLEEIKSSVVAVEAVFADAVPEDLAVPGALSHVTEGRRIRLVLQGEVPEAEAALRASGATEVSRRALPLEEILIACLRSDVASSREREAIRV